MMMKLNNYIPDLMADPFRKPTEPAVV